MAGGTRRLEIEYVITTAQADAQAEAFNGRQRAREKRTLDEAEIAERVRARIAEKSVHDRIAAELKGHAEEERAIARTLSKEEVAEKAKEALVNRLNQRRIEAATAEMAATDRMHKIHMDALDQRLSKFGKQNQSIGEGVAAIGRFGAAMLGLQGAQQVIGVLSDTFASIRQSAFEAAQSVQEMRGSVRELQALRGEMGETGPGIAHVFDIAKDTLQSPEDVKAMESAGLGVGELALKTPEDRAEFTKAMVAAGRFQKLEGGDAGAYGQMMGQIALQSKGPLKAEDMEAQAWRLFQIQQPGGFKTMSQAMGQYAKGNALVQNQIYSPEQLMGMLSMFSVGSPDQAYTKVEQFTRTAMAGKMRARGMKVGDDVDFVKQNEYFKNIGVKHQDDPMEVLAKIVADIGKQSGAAKAKGQRFDTGSYLLSHGMANTEEMFATMDLAGLEMSGRSEKIREAMASPLRKGEISGRFAERLKTDRFYKEERNRIAEIAATAKSGLEEEPLVMAQHAAFNRIKAQGLIGGSFKDWQRIERGGISGATEGGIQDMFMSNYHSQVTREMMHSLESERRRMGVAPIKPEGNMLMPGTAHAYELKFATEIDRRGGDVTAGSEVTMKALASSLDALTHEVKKQNENADKAAAVPPAPMPGKGAAHRVRA